MIADLRSKTEIEVDEASTAIPIAARFMGQPQLVVLALIVVFVGYGATQSDQFLDFQTWINILRNASLIVIVASFSTFVLVHGGLDLSVGSSFVAGGMAAGTAAAAGWPTWLSVCVGVVPGLAAGATNGAIINYLKIPPIIATLGTLFAIRSLVVYFSGGNSSGPLPDSFKRIGQGELFGIPLLIYYAVVIAAVASVILQYTVFGWQIRATGGSSEAARRNGINVRHLSTVVYILSGASASLAGVLLAARLGSASPTVGSGLELDVIAAVIIGGTSLFGAIGSVSGSVVGALLLSVLSTGLILLKIDPALQSFVVGVILIVAVALDQYRRSAMFRLSRRSKT